MVSNGISGAEKVVDILVAFHVFACSRSMRVLKQRFLFVNAESVLRENLERNAIGDANLMNEQTHNLTEIEPELREYFLRSLLVLLIETDMECCHDSIILFCVNNVNTKIDWHAYVAASAEIIFMIK